MFKLKLLILLMAFLTAGFLGSSIKNREPYQKEIKKCTLEKSNPCWTDLIKKVLKERGLKEAFVMVGKVYKADSSFSGACHDIGHYLGKEAFLMQKRGQDFGVTKEAAFCSYGFYHGYMESMIASGEDFEEVRAFCDYVDAQVSKESPDAALQCFHGIGHGWVNVHDEKSLWGDDAAIAKRGLTLCEKITKTEEELSRCATGVYNGISFFYINSEYNLKVRENDPLWLCREQPLKYQAECYLSMNTFLMSFSGGDFSRAKIYIENIKNEDVSSRAMINLAIALGITNMDKEDPYMGASVCSTVQSNLVDECIQGYAFAFLEHGEPGSEYIKSLDFCKNPNHTEAYKNACLSYIYMYLKQWYPSEKVKQICDNQGEYRDLCIKQI